MRIISGIFKGKKIFEPKNANTRPLKDLTKESIFNIIVHSNKLKINIKNSFVLDLFSGVGSFGIECISRGAKHVTFFENYNGVLPILKKNLSSLKIDEKYQVIEQNILNGINLKNSINTFDIIFLDPPYKEKNLKKILDNISSEKLMKDNGVIIIHRHKNEKGQLSENLKIIEEKKYGISKIIFGILN
jgi:16S rRNA (guanine966-N2)-methyltransferase